jgi:hypothetical protein
LPVVTASQADCPLEGNDWQHVMTCAQAPVSVVPPPLLLAPLLPPLLPPLLLPLAPHWLAQLPPIAPSRQLP